MEGRGLAALAAVSTALTEPYPVWVGPHCLDVLMPGLYYVCLVTPSLGAGEVRGLTSLVVSPLAGGMVAGAMFWGASQYGL